MIKNAGLVNSVTFAEDHDITTRIDFLQQLTVLTVPPDSGDAIGSYLLEAFAAGVPVVQPDIGGFGEVVRTSGGGTLYPDNNVDCLVNTLADILTDTNRLKQMGAAGRRAAETVFSLAEEAQSIDKIYTEVING